MVMTLCASGCFPHALWAAVLGPASAGLVPPNIREYAAYTAAGPVGMSYEAPLPYLARRLNASAMALSRP